MRSLCLLGNLHVFRRLLIFSKSSFLKSSFKNTIRVSNSLTFGRAWSGSKSFAKPKVNKSADHTSRQRVLTDPSCGPQQMKNSVYHHQLVSSKES